MSSDADATDRELSPDLVFELLSSARRRMVLYYLRRHGGSATVSDLAKQIAAMENDIDVEDLTRQQQKRVYVSLYQTHIPKLDESGIIDYDDESGEVTLTNRAVEIDTYLTPTAESTYPWQLHYLALAVGSWLVLVAGFAGLPVVGAVPMVWLGVLIAAAFAVSALAHYVDWRRRQNRLPAELAEEE